MSKRSSFNKIPKDFYPTTDPNAIPPKFIEFIRGRSYAEPCYGEGDLEDLLMDVAVCRWRSDIRRTVDSCKLWDALCLSKHEIARCDMIVTNPPFSRDVLLPMIDHFITLKPTWLLLPADYMHNKYFSPYMAKCSKVVSVGRLFWFKSTWQTKTFNVDIDILPWYSEKVRESPWFNHRASGWPEVTYTGWWCDKRNHPTQYEFTRSTDNFAWYFWEKGATTDTQTIFIGRS